MARPSKLTPDIGERISKLIAAGVPIGTACQVEGITRKTLSNWRKRAEAGEQDFAAFWSQVEKALAKAEAAITMHVVKAAQHDWRAGAWWLERRSPKTYGNKQTVRVEKPLPELSEEELEAAIAQHGYVRAPDNGSDGQS